MSRHQGRGPAPSFSRRLRRAFGLIVGLLLVSSAAGVAGLLVVAANADATLNHLEPLALANVRALQDLTNAETGLRGYLLTHRRSFLQPYYAGVRSFPRDCDEEARLAADHPGLLSEVDAAREAGLDWLSYAGPLTIEPGGSRPALLAVDIRGKRLFDSFRAANSIVAEAVSAQLGRRSTETELIHDGALAGVIVLGLVAIFGGLLVATWTERSVTRPLDGIRSTLARLAAGERGARAPLAGPAEVQAVGLALNALADENERLSRQTEDRRRFREPGDALARRIRRDLDLDAVMAEAVEGLGTALQADRCLIRLVTAKDRLGRIAGQWCREGLQPISSGERDAPLDLERVILDAARAGGTVAVVDVRLDTRFTLESQAFLESLGLRSFVFQPLILDGGLFGIVVIGAGSPRDWGPSDVDLVGILADDLGRALAHARLYRQQEETVTQLQELDRAKSGFLSTVSHELRTPLTSIIGYLELLEEAEAGPVTPVQAGMLETIRRNTERLRALIEDLLTLSRVEAGTLRSTREEVVLGDLVRSVRVALQPLADRAQVRLHPDPGPADLLVMGDRSQLERVVINLASNAIKFTPAGGEVTIQARREKGEGLLVVSDTGIGIPEAEREAVFSQFHRASDASERAIPGTGLGLSIVKAIVEHHGGSVALDSEVDRGTTVVVRLPLGSGNEVAIAPAAAGST